MTDLQDLVRRIERLEARAEIGELVSAYGIACDEHDMPRLLSLFTEDAVFDSPSQIMQASGRGEIEALFTRMLSVRGPAYHWTHDRFVTFDAAEPDRATGLVLSHAETTPDGIASIAAMRYQDVYHRGGGRWRFARRTISFLYYLPVTEFATGLTARQRLVANGRRLPADYPESLPVWQAFEKQHGRRPVPAS